MYGSTMTPSLRNPRLQGRSLPGGGYAGDQEPYDATAFTSELDAYLQYVNEQIAGTNASSFLTRASATVWNALYSYPAKAAYLEGLIRGISAVQGNAQDIYQQIKRGVENFSSDDRMCRMLLTHGARLEAKLEISNTPGRQAIELT